MSKVKKLPEKRTNYIFYISPLEQKLMDDLMNGPIITDMLAQQEKYFSRRKAKRELGKNPLLLTYIK